MHNGNESRESQKKRLRRQIVPAGTEERSPGRGGRNSGGYGNRYGNGSGTAGIQPGGRRFLRLIPGVVVFLALLFFGVGFYLTNRHHDGFEVIWEKKNETAGDRGESFRGYESFAKGFLRYTKDGASYVDGNGKTIWERSYQMQNPIAAVNGDYAVIADQLAQSLYIFSDSANTGVASTVLPISRVSISQTGVVYAILKDEKADYITAFKPDGSGIDLSIKSIITGDGYPLDLSVSPDGTELLTSYVSIENSQVVQKVIFRNFDEVGKAADGRRVVGGFTEEFEGHLVGRVHFSSNEYSQAFYDGGIAFFSTKVLTSPELISQVTFEEEIASIACSEKYVAVVLSTNSGEEPYRLELYKANGSKLAEASFSFPYTKFAIEGSQVLLYNESDCRIYNLQGREILSAAFPGPVSAVTKAGLPGQYLLFGSEGLMKVRLQ